MTTKRRESAKRKRDENGNVVCSCGCGRPPGPGRRTWHSQECVDRWMVANSSQYVRSKLFERDKGVCAMCGVDSVKAERRARKAMSHYWQQWHGYHARIDSWHRRHGWSVPVPEFLKQMTDRSRWYLPRINRAMESRLAAMRADGWNVNRRSSWWEADHIVPVVEGGGQCGIENYRTLCVRCHLKVTRELRARLSAKRKATK